MTNHICLGHLEPIIDRCYSCSGNNSSCCHYQSMSIHSQSYMDKVEHETLVLTGLERFLKKYPNYELQMKGGRKNGFTQGNNTRVSTNS